MSFVTGRRRAPTGEGVEAWACESCGGRTKIIDSRKDSAMGFTRRRRSCLSCRHRFTTYEVPAWAARALVSLMDAISYLSPRRRDLVE